MSVKVSRGEFPVETQVIDAHLERLGVVVDPATREVRSEGIENSRVKGGLAGLGKAAKATGAPEVLDLEDLPAIHERFDVGRAIARIRGKDDATVAGARLKATAMTLNGAAINLEGFCEKANSRGEFDLRELASTLRFLNKATVDLSAAIESSTLAHATAEDVTALRHGYAHLMDAIGKYGGALDILVNNTYRPQARALANQHNAGGLWQRLSNGIPVETMHAIELQLATLNESVAALSRAHVLFDPNPPESRLAACAVVEIVEKGPGGMFVGGEKTAREIGWAIDDLERAHGLPPTAAAVAFGVVLRNYVVGQQTPGRSAAADALMAQLRAVEASVPYLTRPRNLTATAELLVAAACDAHPGDPKAIYAYLDTVQGAQLPASHPHSTARG